ncbi:SNF2 family N-terminal domain-containing protein [Leptodontidium sp. MPI-SDFR-AT-0119]|nr:SNF2 family N-terminal domain-containing protein [Leptodontidium sp. MPI-SDFR-AT-0119]
MPHGTPLKRFVNTISNAYQVEEPPQFSGGIIADPMGLGKTLTMIALVATDLDNRRVPREIMGYEKCYTSATLVIMFPTLLGSWEEQLIEYVRQARFGWWFKCRRPYGQTKLANISRLEQVDIVLTTYYTVSAEWKSSRDTGGSVLFQVCWRRIILDEAHFIRNGQSKMARAIYDLDSTARWAVSGTPIQNRLGDLVSLLKFIRAHPYDDPDRFDTDISQIWKSGKDQDTTKRLRRLSACLLLRRAKGTIDLPPRRDFLLPIYLSYKERAVYDELRE